MCDALLDGLKIAVNSGFLPTAGGMLATVVLTMTEHAYRTGAGFATTSHGAQVPVREALSGRGRTQLSQCTRIPKLARACWPLTTRRDGAQPSSHHVTEWQDTHRTFVDDAALLCGHHHREVERLGWRVKIINGRPEKTPPRSIDPEQKPIRV